MSTSDNTLYYNPHSWEVERQRRQSIQHNEMGVIAILDDDPLLRPPQVCVPVVMDFREGTLGDVVEIGSQGQDPENILQRVEHRFPVGSVLFTTQYDMTIYYVVVSLGYDLQGRLNVINARPVTPEEEAQLWDQPIERNRWFNTR